MKLAKISYSVPFKDIPHSVSNIVKQAHEKLHDTNKNLFIQSDNLNKDEPSFVKILEEIDNTRVKLLEVDSMLIDITSIIVGYQNILTDSFIKEGENTDIEGNMEEENVIKTD